MSTVIFLTGSTRGDTMGAITRSIMGMISGLGIETVEINFNEPAVQAKLDKTLREKKILFVFSFVAIGRDLNINGENGGPDKNLWEALGIPFIAVHGDSPAYFFDRHVNISPLFASLYGFDEHYTFRKRLPKQVGLLGLSPAIVIDPVPRDSIDFRRKEQGKLVFLKNAGDPTQLKTLWQSACPPKIYQMLLDIAAVLESQIHTDLGGDIDSIVLGLFREKGLDVEAMTNLRLFFVAQLDDYLRRLKTVFMADVLSDFPVEIHGDNWNHYDFSGKACTMISGCDYAKSREVIASSLGIIDMSPNTGGGFHDRLERCYGRHTLCLTNEQACVTKLFGANCGLTFTFQREVLQQKIADVLAHPKQYVEIGIETSRIFSATYTPEVMGNFLLEVADTLRIGGTKMATGMQNFFVWPPKSLALP